MRYRTKLALWLVAIALFVSGAATALHYAFSRSYLVAEIESKAVSIAATAAAALSGDGIEGLASGGPDGRRELEARLASMRDVNRRGDVHVVFLYLAAAGADGRLTTIASTAATGGGRAEPNLTSSDRIRLGETGVEELKHDAYGVWVSGYAPVRDGSGRPAFTLVADVAAHDLQGRLRLLLWSGLGAMGLALLVAAGTAVPLAGRVTRPLESVVAAIERIARGDLEARVRVAGADEFGRLGQAVNGMVPKLRDHLRLRQSVQVAQEVQRNLLPAGWPRISSFEIAGTSSYCDEIGGDYYDFLDVSESGHRRLAVVVGDVVGHGIAAALLMATTRAMLRARMAGAGTGAQVLTDVNAAIYRDRFSERFVTLYLLVIDTRDLTLRWVCAGHEPALLYDPATDSFEELGGADVPLGIAPDWAYREHARVGWRSGQVILIGTDGIWETRNPERQMFGRAAVREIVRAHAHRSAREIHEEVLGALARFRGGLPQDDDVTLVVLKA